jgi:predicted helicase
LPDARRQLLLEKDLESLVCKCNYRVFDERYVIYHDAVVDRRRYEVLGHMLNASNTALIAQRQTYGLDFNHIFISAKISDLNYISNLGGGSVFPLYCYPDPTKFVRPDADWPPGKDGRVPNLQPEFVKRMSTATGLEFVSDGKGDLAKTFGPENIMTYIYAIFHSPTYRFCYAEFLKVGFPRVPLTTNLHLFKELCYLGDVLVSLHLMQSAALKNNVTTFAVSGNNNIVKVGGKGKALTDVKGGKGKLSINKTQYFDDVPEDVWNFHIGGYQVCHKWLADRKKAGRKLSAEDIEHYHKIVVAINETIKIMKQIDEVIAAHGGWPIK